MLTVRFYRYGLVAVFAVALLGGCGRAHPAGGGAGPVQVAAGPVLSLNSSVGTIAADPRGKAILDRDVPGMTSNPSWAFVQGMTLPQLQGMSSGQMSQAQVNQVGADLAKLPPQ